MEILETIYGGNSLRTLLTAVGIVILLTLLLYTIRKIATRRLAAFARKTATDLDDLLVDLLAKTRFLFLFGISLYAASHTLSMTDTVHNVVRVAFILLLLLQIGFWGSGLIVYLIRKAARQRLAEDTISSTTLAVLGFIGKVVLWSVIVLLALENFGFNISALVAGLGITGIAVALAVQNILGDLLASLTIVLDKPFVIGDFIVVDAISGNVEHIGIKTTRVRSISGEQIIISNADLLKSRIRNFKRMQERRISFSVVVAYETPRSLIERIPELIRELVTGQEGARFDRSHFQALGESGLVFETVYFVKDPDYLKYMNIQQRINVGIVSHFKEAGIQFAYPTRTVYLQSSGVNLSQPV